MTRLRQLSKLNEAVQALDMELMDKINQRIELVMIIKRLTEREGVSFSDPGMAESSLQAIRQSNKGPLPSHLMEELWSHILTFSKVVSDGRDPEHHGSIQKH